MCTLLFALCNRFLSHLALKRFYTTLLTPYCELSCDCVQITRATRSYHASSPHQMPP